MRNHLLEATAQDLGDLGYSLDSASDTQWDRSNLSHFKGMSLDVGYCVQYYS